MKGRDVKSGQKPTCPGRIKGSVWLLGPLLSRFIYCSGVQPVKISGDSSHHDILVRGPVPDAQLEMHDPRCILSRALPRRPGAACYTAMFAVASDLEVGARLPESIASATRECRSMMAGGPGDLATATDRRCVPVRDRCPRSRRGIHGEIDVLAMRIRQIDS